jgi:hypothetical protein
MKQVIELRHQEPFAKSQKGRDLQVCYDAGELETQFMDAIDSAYDFFRFLKVFDSRVSKQSSEVF